MKKIFYVALFLILLCPVTVFAKISLAKSINVDGIGNAPLRNNSWKCYLTTTLDYTDIKVTPISDDVVVEGAGRVQIQEGDNEIPITLKQGDVTETFTIHMVMKRPKLDSNGNPETGSFIPYALGGLVIIGLAGFVVSRKSSIKKI